jgi:hypothetical protein
MRLCDIWEWETVGRGRVKGSERDQWTLQACMKIEQNPSKRRGKVGQEKVIEGVSLIKVHYMHIRKSHNDANEREKGAGLDT